MRAAVEQASGVPLPVALDRYGVSSRARGSWTHSSIYFEVERVARGPKARSNSLRSPVTPALEEECNGSRFALITQIAHPHRMHGACPRARFAPNDDPVKSAKPMMGKRPNPIYKRANIDA